MKGIQILDRTDKILHVISRIISDITLFICNILLIVVTLEVIMGVFYRYVLRDPIYWSEEVARYILVWMAMLGASVGTQKREHLRLDSFTDKLPLHVQKVLEMLLNIFIVVMLLLVFPWLMQWLRGSGVTTRSPAVQMPMFVPLGSLAVGLVLIIFQTAVCAVRDLLYLLGAWMSPDGIRSLQKEDSL